jgi:hypothetical protein
MRRAAGGGEYMINLIPAVPLYETSAAGAVLSAAW